MLHLVRPDLGNASAHLAVDLLLQGQFELLQVARLEVDLLELGK